MHILRKHWVFPPTNSRPQTNLVRHYLTSCWISKEQAPWPPAKSQVSSQFPWQLNSCSQKQKHMKLSGNLYIISFWMWASNLLEMQAPRWKVSPPFKFDPSYHPTVGQSGEVRIFQMLSILPDWWMQGKNQLSFESNWPIGSMKPTFQKIYNCLCILSKADAESNAN